MEHNREMVKRKKFQHYVQTQVWFGHATACEHQIKTTSIKHLEKKNLVHKGEQNVSNSVVVHCWKGSSQLQVKNLEGGGKDHWNGMRDGG